MLLALSIAHLTHLLVCIRILATLKVDILSLVLYITIIEETVSIPAHIKHCSILIEHRWALVGHAIVDSLPRVPSCEVTL